MEFKINCVSKIVIFSFLIFVSLLLWRPALAGGCSLVCSAVGGTYKFESSCAEKGRLLNSDTGESVSFRQVRKIILRQDKTTCGTYFETVFEFYTLELEVLDKLEAGNDSTVFAICELQSSNFPPSEKYYAGACNNTLVRSKKRIVPEYKITQETIPIQGDIKIK